MKTDQEDGPSEQTLQRVGLTQTEVALILGISRARVMQLEQSALRKMRRDPVLRRMGAGLAGGDPM